MRLVLTILRSLAGSPEGGAQVAMLRIEAKISVKFGETEWEQAIREIKAKGWAEDAPEHEFGDAMIRITQAGKERAAKL